jgi:hypothetical protein
VVEEYVKKEVQGNARGTEGPPWGGLACGPFEGTSLELRGLSLSPPKPVTFAKEERDEEEVRGMVGDHGGTHEVVI